MTQVNGQEVKGHGNTVSQQKCHKSAVETDFRLSENLLCIGSAVREGW